jgi:hypothetical protein
MQSSACAGVNIWSGNEKERSCWRDGRGIGEIGERVGERMRGKMREERCEGERAAQVSSSVGVVVNVQWSQIRGTPFRPLVKKLVGLNCGAACK